MQPRRIPPTPPKAARRKLTRDELQQMFMEAARNTANMQREAS
jgi:hypothetical protein